MTLASSGAAPVPARGVAPATSVEAARRYCRAVLPRVSRTFALNIRLLSGPMGETVRIAYLLCRVADTIEDSWPGDRAEIELRFDQLLAAVGGDADDARALAAAAVALLAHADAAQADLVASTPAVLLAFSALPPADRHDVADAVTAMARGMRRYAGRAADRGAAFRAELRDAPASHADPSPASSIRADASRVATFAYLDDEAELDDYCWIVAGCVGVMLTRLVARRAATTGAEARRLELAPSVGEGLQLTNILLDWPTDIRTGRCHLPASWLAEHGLGPRDLAGPDRPELHALARRLEDRAWGALERVPDYLATLPSRHARYRMFCLWPAVWAAASLRHARRDPAFPAGPRRPRLPKSELWGLAGAALALGHTDRGVRGLLRGPARLESI